MRAGPLLANIGYSLADTGYWRAAVIVIAAAFLIMLLVTQFGKGAKLEKGAEIAFSRARQLLHEADKENRNVRPLPLTLAKVLYIPDMEELREGYEAPTLQVTERREAGEEVCGSRLSRVLSTLPSSRVLRDTDFSPSRDKHGQHPAKKLAAFL